MGIEPGLLGDEEIRGAGRPWAAGPPGTGYNTSSVENVHPFADLFERNERPIDVFPGEGG
jgi:hypothetical protein